MKEKDDFAVYTWTIMSKNMPTYCHWAEELNMMISKNGIKIELNSDEIQQLVKSLPKTMGGSY